MPIIDWKVLARQLALVFVPLLVQRGLVPASIEGPLTEALTYVFGTVVVAFVIWLGQRREKPDIKIAEAAALPQVAAIEVTDAKLAADIPSRKVTT